MARSALKVKTTDIGSHGGRHRPIDLAFLAKQTLGDPGLETEILIMFDKMAETYLQRLKDPADAGAFALSLHSLKGAALGVGAGAVARHARDAEVELKATGAVMAERIDDLAMSVSEAHVFIGELLER